LTEHWTGIRHIRSARDNPAQVNPQDRVSLGGKNDILNVYTINNTSF